MDTCHTTDKIKTGTVFTLLSFLIVLIYINTFNVPWHFDDIPNIVKNGSLHLEDLKPESLARAIYSNPVNPWEANDKMYRPVSCLTFALNWYFGKDDVKGYHLVNIAFTF